LPPASERLNAHLSGVAQIGVAVDDGADSREAHVILFILVLLLFGLVAGAIARLLVPGRDDFGVLGTAVLGIVGSLVGGFLFQALFVPGDQEGVPAAGLLGSIVGAVVVLLVWRLVTGSSRRGLV
jgi:uncharacterized membrane protein YeaQ/YmgE (transglycosylase-associated protein family)